MGLPACISIEIVGRRATGEKHARSVRGGSAPSSSGVFLASGIYGLSAAAHCRPICSRRRRTRSTKRFSAQGQRRASRSTQRRPAEWECRTILSEPTAR
jgi:hypothetical protein